MKTSPAPSATIRNAESAPETIAVPRLLSPADLAAYVGVPIATVYRWTSRRDGSGPQFSRVGKHVRFDVSDVQAWLREAVVPQRTAR